MNYLQKFTNSKKLFILVGIFHSLAILVFLSSICTFSYPTITSRIDISLASKLHFDYLKQRLYFLLLSRIVLFFLLISSQSWLVLQSCPCSLQVLLYTIVSKIILFWLEIPLFNSLLFLNLYSQIRSNSLKYLVFLSLSITSPISGSSVLSLIVSWFNFLQSYTNCRDLSFFTM